MRILVTGSRTWTDVDRLHSRGATHCADLAERAGIPTRRYTA